LKQVKDSTVGEASGSVSMCQRIRGTITLLRRSASCLTVARRMDRLPGNRIIGF
jgi:hypothetical protein